MSIQSRIVRGIGFGAVSLSMLGFYSADVEPPVIPRTMGFDSSLLGNYSQIEKIAAAKRRREDDELLMLLL